MKKAVFVVLPILFMAQACNFLFGDLTGSQGSGSRGVFLSTDGGQSWQEANTLAKNQSLQGVQVQKLVFSQSDSKNVLAITLNAGVFATNDGAKSWFSILPNVAGYDAFIDPHDAKTIFVSGIRGSLAVILKSPDAGKTWVQIYSEPAGKAAVTAMAFDPRNPVVFFAGISTGTVIKTLDGGNTWDAVSQVSDRISELAFAPDGNTLYLMGRNQGMRRSVDGGRTWTALPLAKSGGPYNDFALDPQNPSTLYLATDKGLFRSSDAGATWLQMLLPATPQVNTVSTVAINPQNARQIFTAVQSTTYRSDDFGNTWKPVMLPTNRVISNIAIDPNELNRVYVGLR